MRENTEANFGNKEPVDESSSMEAVRYAPRLAVVHLLSASNRDRCAGTVFPLGNSVRRPYESLIIESKIGNDGQSSLLRSCSL